MLKLKDVLWPAKSFKDNDAHTKDWDLWGPLVFCLILSLLLSFGASDNQSQVVFTGVFSMVWLGEAVCTLNLKLLGGTVYFFRTNRRRSINFLGAFSRACVSWGTVCFR